jgi:hypothetical protein
MVKDLAGGVWRQAVAGNGRENLKNIEGNGRMALGRIRLLTFRDVPYVLGCNSSDSTCETFLSRSTGTNIVSNPGILILSKTLLLSLRLPKSK